MGHLVYNGDKTRYQDEEDMGFKDMLGEDVENEIDRHPNISARLIKHIAEEAGYYPESSGGPNFPPSPKSERMFENVKENVVRPNADSDWSEHRIELQAHSTCEEFGKILYDNRYEIANKAENKITRYKNRGFSSVLVDATLEVIPLIGSGLNSLVDYGIDKKEQDKLDDYAKQYLRRAAERHSNVYN